MLKGRNQDTQKLNAAFVHYILCLLALQYKDDQAPSRVRFLVMQLTEFLLLDFQ